MGDTFGTILTPRLSWRFTSTWHLLSACENLGRTVALAGVAMIISMGTGLYLWWPRNRTWRSAFTLKRSAAGRRLIDLHNIAARYLFIPLLIVAATGVYSRCGPIGSTRRFRWYRPYAALTQTPAQTSKPGSCQAQTTPGQALAVAQARFPTAKFVSIFIPTDRPYVVQLAPPNNLGEKGQTQVYVDRECPVILTVTDGEVGVFAETFKAVMHPLHRNLMLGRVGDVITALCGILLPVSFVTGLLLWLNGRKSRPSPAHSSTWLLNIPSPPR